jgi:hypothetical protein
MLGRFRISVMTASRISRNAAAALGSNCLPACFSTSAKAAV